MQQRTSYATSDQRELKWVFGDPRERPFDIVEEPPGKPAALRVVPARGILEIGLRK